ncbi:exported hypothetical protein [metagenome]|uniref:PknH-like extracellular domain-containing protein n=1 Tax=metagenome TaxID=256318 RepID=A0A2P2BZB2_9ZZZZ
MAPLPRRQAVSLVFVVMLLTAAGCADAGSPVADDPTTAATRASEDPTPEPSTDSSTSASAEPSEDPPSSTPSAPPSGLRSALLGAAQVPALNTGYTWRSEGTVAEPGDPSGVCQKTPLVTIGATAAFVRTYAPAADDSDTRASQVVAGFADPKSAWRTYQVLTSWRAQCADFMDFTEEKVGDLVALPVDTGVAHRFLVSYLPDGATDTRIVAYGMTRVGRHISLVQFDLTGQDWNYPSGEEPESVAIGRINPLLARLG